MECPICVEKYGKKLRKCIACPSCQAEACSNCLKQFLTQNTIEPKCMSCNTRWNLDFLRTSLSRAFMVSDYRKHQTASLLAEAETFIPQYQERLLFQDECARRSAEIRALEFQKKELEQRIMQKKVALFNFQSRPTGAAEAKDREAFFMACPRTDCRGRVSTGYKCGLCAHFFCADCHGDKGTMRDAAHECNKDDVDTVRLLKQNTKQCPKCHTGIFKTEGCDQMWCVSCHTCFSWNTGRILNGVVHNPHYYEYMRRVNGGAAPRNPGDVLCGGIPNVNEVLHAARRIGSPVDGDQVKRFSDVHRMLVHMENVSVPDMQRVVRRNAPTMDLGVAYLRKKISREEWGDNLYKLAVKRERDERFLDLMTMMTHNGGDLVRNFVGNPVESGFETTLKNLEALVEYANEQVEVFNRQFGTKRQAFNPALKTYNF